MRLLIVEDDDRGARYLVRGLSESGHTVDRAADGETSLALALEGIYDVLVVDRRLPGLDGIALVQRLREQGIATPALMLSAIANAADRVAGLRAGCDDYLAKPYAFAEVLARVEGLARRAEKACAQAVLHYMYRLRRKIDHGFDHQLIKTIRGAGYMLDDRETS